jgi:drug/metabolite transporter (DMT)-like permease
MTEAMPAPAAKSRLSTVDLLLVTMSFIWGINFSVVKGALADFSPLSFNAIRFGTASLILLSLLWIRERSLSIRSKDVGFFIMLALIGNTAYQLFFINGIALTTATNSALILATTPVFIVLFGAVLRVERITSRIVQGVILSFTGVVMIILGSGRPLTITDQSLIGDLLEHLHGAFETPAEAVFAASADCGDHGYWNCASSARFDSIVKHGELARDFN